MNFLQRFALKRERGEEERVYSSSGSIFLALLFASSNSPRKHQRPNKFEQFHQKCNNKIIMRRTYEYSGIKWQEQVVPSGRFVVRLEQLLNPIWLKRGSQPRRAILNQ